MRFEWDPEKARSNLRKHKVSFEEAATALRDPMAATGCDPDHSVRRVKIKSSVRLCFRLMGFIVSIYGIESKAYRIDEEASEPWMDTLYLVFCRK